MTDETDNLVLEHLKRFQSQMNRFEERLDTVQQDMRAMKQHMSAFMASEAAQDEASLAWQFAWTGSSAGSS